MGKTVESRAQFLLERLDRRRLLSVTAPTDVAEEVQAGDAEVAITEDVASEDAQVLTLDVPTDAAEEEGGDFIRCTMIPADNERNLDKQPTEEPLQNLEDVPSDGIFYMSGSQENSDDVEILVLEQDPAVLEDPNVIYYTMGAPEQKPVESAGATELPPPPAQASALAPAKSLSDDVLGISDGNVLA
jgi:hypothetical protein